MYKISEIVGKNLIDVNSTRELGKIVDVGWRKLSKTCAIRTENGVYSAENMTVKTDARIVDAQDTEMGETLVNKPVYDVTGEFLGKVVDAEFGKSLKLAKIYLENGTCYGRGKIYAVKDVILLRATVPASPKKAIPTDTPTNTQKVAEAEGPAESNTSTNRSTAAPWRQNRKYGDFSFLVGKVVDKNITNFQGEVMIKYGEKVTHDVLRQAKVSGKLIELCLHTK